MVTADMRGLDTSGSTLAKIIREITGPDGEQHYGSVDGLKAAINAIKAGKNIWYVGATGPIDFDPYGDVATPFVMMKIKDGDYVDVGGISLEEVSEVKAKVRAMNN